MELNELKELLEKAKKAEAVQERQEETFAVIKEAVEELKTDFSKFVQKIESIGGVKLHTYLSGSRVRGTKGNGIENRKKIFVVIKEAGLKGITSDQIAERVDIKKDNVYNTYLPEMLKLGVKRRRDPTDGRKVFYYFDGKVEITRIPEWAKEIFVTKEKQKKVGEGVVIEKENGDYEIMK